MMKYVLAVLLLLLPAFAARAAEVEFSEVSTALENMMADSDSAIPAELLRKAEGIAVFVDVTKIGLGIGGRRGHGVVLARDAQGNWGAPAYFVLTGVSSGFQIGYEVMDIVLLIMSEKDMKEFVTNTITLGAGASVAAGPKRGATHEADTSTDLDSGVLSYVRVTAGAYAGISLKGARIKYRDEDTAELYGGKNLSAQDVVLDGKVSIPAGAVGVINTLRRLEAE